MCFFSIPTDFCIEFWNSTFSPILEYTEEIFLIIWRKLSDGANPGCVAVSGVTVNTVARKFCRSGGKIY